MEIIVIRYFEDFESQNHFFFLQNSCDFGHQLVQSEAKRTVGTHNTYL